MLPEGVAIGVVVGGRCLIIRTATAGKQPDFAVLIVLPPAVSYWVCVQPPSGLGVGNERTGRKFVVARPLPTPLVCKKTGLGPCKILGLASPISTNVRAVSFACATTQPCGCPQLVSASTLCGVHVSIRPSISIKKKCARSVRPSGFSEQEKGV